jgi:WXG100 family type VII secretion target
VEQELRVDPADVRIGANFVDMHAGDLHEGHDAAHKRITAAQSGWIGASEAALSARMTELEEETAAHCRELHGHRDNLRTAADSYDTTDTDAVAGFVQDQAELDHIADPGERMRF